jgi:hypothetical protein
LVFQFYLKIFTHIIYTILNSFRCLNKLIMIKYFVDLDLQLIIKKFKNNVGRKTAILIIEIAVFRNNNPRKGLIIIAIDYL